MRIHLHFTKYFNLCFVSWFEFCIQIITNSESVYSSLNVDLRDKRLFDVAQGESGSSSDCDFHTTLRGTRFDRLIE